MSIQVCDNMRIGVVGAAGIMGSVYTPEFLSHGHGTLGFDTNGEKMRRLYGGTNVGICESTPSLIDAVGDGLYVLATPIQHAHEHVAEYADKLPRGATMLTFTSAKTLEARAFDENRQGYEGVTVILGHPLHGGNKPKGQGFARVTMQDPAKTVDAVDNDVLKPLGLNIYPMGTAWEHDKVMGDVQGNTHLVYSSAFLAWSRLGINPFEHPAYSNVLDNLKAAFALRLGAANHEVYSGIAAFNPAVRYNVRAFSAARGNIMDMRRGKDRTALRRLLDGVKDHVGRDEIERAYGILTRLFGDYDPEQQANSQMSMLIMGEAMRMLGVHPKDNMVFKTPPYQARWMINMLALHGDTDHYVDNLIGDGEMVEHDTTFSSTMAQFEAAVLDEDSAMRFNVYKDLLGEGVGNFRAAAKVGPNDEIPALKLGKQRSDEAIAKLMAETA